MNYEQLLIDIAKQRISEHPDKRGAIIDLVQLFQSEVKGGEPEDNEYEIAVYDINELCS